MHRFLSRFRSSSTSVRRIGRVSLRFPSQILWMQIMAPFHHDSHMHDMKPYDFDLFNARTSGNVDWDSDMNRDEEPPQYLNLDSSNIPSYAAAIRGCVQPQPAI